MTSDENPEFGEEKSAKSKTQIKKEMIALQELGVKISRLSLDQQSEIPMNVTLRSAIEGATKIKTNSAKQRHIQYIGKLMRAADIEAINRAYEKVTESSQKATKQHHLMEYWRDLLIEDKAALERFIEQYPHIDRQQLRQVVRSALKDKAVNKPDGGRKLFRFIRDNLRE